jgi:hypothetical protein
MPTLETVSGPLVALGDALDAQSSRERVGWHVTDLIKIRRLLAHPNSTTQVREYFKGSYLPDWVRNLGAIGKIWEEAVMRTYVMWYSSEGSRVDEKVEAECDGVTGSLDGMFYPSNGSAMVIECKCRFGWSSEDPRHYRDWMPQCLAYCHMVGTTEVLMPVLYLPATSREVRFLQHRITFSKGEVEGNWSTLMTAKAKAEAMGYSSNDLPRD